MTKVLPSEVEALLLSLSSVTKLKLPSLWTRSYYCGTAGNMSSETIKKYIANQKTN